MESRVKNSARNIIWIFVEKVVMVIFPFALKTIMLKTMGAEYLGVNSLFTSILSILNIAELGFSSSIVFCLYKPIAENDEAVVCALINFYRKIYFAIGSIVAILGVILIPFLNALVKGEYPPELNIVLLYALFLLNDVCGYFLFSYKSCILSVTQREDVLSKVNLSLKMGLYVMQAVCLAVFHSYYGFVMVMVINTVVTNIVTAYYSNKLFPQYKCKGKISNDQRKYITKNVKGLIIGKMAMVSRNSFDSVFLSMFLGLRMVAIYSNYYYILSAVVSFVLVVTKAITPSVGNSMATESKEKNHQDLLKFTFLYSWICGWFGTTMVCLYQPFMIIWMGNDMLLPWIDVFLFGMYFYTSTMGDIKSTYTHTAGLFWESRFYVLSEAIVNVMLNFFLGKIFGISGIIVATTISILIINVGWGSGVLYKHFFFEYSLKKYLLKHIEYLLYFVCVSMVTLFISCKVSIGGVGGLIIKVVICLIVPNILYWLGYRKFSIYADAKAFVKYAISEAVR